MKAAKPTSRFLLTTFLVVVQSMAFSSHVLAKKKRRKSAKKAAPAKSKLTPKAATNSGTDKKKEVTSPTAPQSEIQCSQAGKIVQVKVLSQTTIRRGPGLNYPVIKVLNAPTCFKMGEVSMDETWVLIEAGDLFGWVPSTRLSKEGQKRIHTMVPDRAPVGSGQTRGYVWTNQSTNLQETPQVHSKMVRLVAMGERLLALASTGDGVWIQVRDRRGDQGWIRARRIRDETGVLAGLPRTSRGVKVETVKLTEGTVGGTKTILVPMQQGVLIDAEASIGVAFPQLSLDSDGDDFFRRYNIQATAPTMRIKATTTSLKPVSISFEYDFTYLAGLSSTLAENTSTARTQTVHLSVGWPVVFDSFGVMPRAGIFFNEADVDPILPGDPIDSGGTFFSQQTNAATLGINVQTNLTDDISLQIDAGTRLGTTQESPFDLGEADLTIGFDTSISARYALTDDLAILAQAHGMYQNSPYSGGSVYDQSITEASLTWLSAALHIGAVFAL